MTCMTRSTVHQDLLNFMQKTNGGMTHFRIKPFIYSRSSHVITYVTRHVKQLLWASEHCGSSYGANTWADNLASFTFRATFVSVDLTFNVSAYSEPYPGQHPTLICTNCRVPILRIQRASLRFYEQCPDGRPVNVESYLPVTMSMRDHWSAGSVVSAAALTSYWKNPIEQNDILQLLMIIFK